MSAENGACSACRYWIPFKDEDGQPLKRGECRRMPPTASGLLNVLDALYYQGGHGPWPEAFSEATMDTQTVMDQVHSPEMATALTAITQADYWCGEYSESATNG